MITTAPVMVSMLDSSAIDVDQINVYRTGICCFLGKQTALRSKSHMLPTDCYCSEQELKDPTTCVGLVQSGHQYQYHLVEM